MLMWTSLLLQMIAFTSITRIVALSIVLASTLSSAAPMPSPGKAVGNLNQAFVSHITARGEETKNSEEEIWPAFAFANAVGQSLHRASGQGVGQSLANALVPS